jgi:hypothetical protein
MNIFSSDTYFKTYLILGNMIWIKLAHDSVYFYGDGDGNFSFHNIKDLLHCDEDGSNERG